MRSRPRRASAALALALAAAAPAAFAGAQRYELLSASVRTALAHAVNDNASYDAPDEQTRRWIHAMAPRLAGRFRDGESVRRFLVLVRYEARRAGLDPQLVLAVIDVESHFRKYAISTAGARGLMQVMPFWVAQIGVPGQDLFEERTNLRYGCTILRYYLDQERGNLVNALGRYNGSLGQPQYPARVLGALRTRWMP